MKNVFVKFLTVFCVGQFGVNYDRENILITYHEISRE